MAKKSKIVRNDRRREIVARYAERRAELKEIIRSPSSTVEQRAAAQRELARQPRDASAVRLRNRDAADGRPRGHLRKFGLSRIRSASWPIAGSYPACGRRAGDGQKTSAGSSCRPAGRQARQEEPSRRPRGQRGRLQGHRRAASVHLRTRQNPLPPRHRSHRPTTTPGQHGNQKRPRNGVIALPGTGHWPLKHVVHQEIPVRMTERIGE